MDAEDLRFQNWKQSIEEILADVAMQQQAAMTRHQAAMTRHQAAEKRMDAAEKRMDAAEKRMDAADRRMCRFERNLVRLANLGLKARNGLTRRQQEHEANMARIEQEHQARQKEHEANMARIELNLAEISDKLNGLIGYVQNQHPPQP